MDITAAVLLVACALAFSTANTSLAERSSSSSSLARAAVDRESLLHFKRSIKHDPFHVLDSWNNVLPNSATHHCNWTGITCSSKHLGRVISLNLANSTIQEYGVGGDVTSKGDVYSFGIVVLEVMTRKKPTNDMFNGSMSMLEWVSMAAVAEEDINREKLKSILEIENCSDEELKRIEGVIKLGIVCCNEDPLQRPTMREVENLLSIIVGSDVHMRRSMPNLDDIVDSLQVNHDKLPRESTFSSTF